MQSFRIQLQRNSPTFDELNEMEYARLSLKQREFTKNDVFVAFVIVVAY